MGAYTFPGGIGVAPSACQHATMQFEEDTASTELVLNMCLTHAAICMQGMAGLLGQVLFFMLQHHRETEVPLLVGEFTSMCSCMNTVRSSPCTMCSRRAGQPGVHTTLDCAQAGSQQAHPHLGCHVHKYEQLPAVSMINKSARCCSSIENNGHTSS